MASDKKIFPGKANRQPLDQFLQQLARVPQVRPGEGSRGRLLFAMDATASRQAAWDQAMHIQAQMFAVTDSLGGLDIQLAYYRGYHEFEVSAWCSSAAPLQRHMSAVACHAGQTQIERVLRHAVAETRRRKVHAVVFIGDCMEESLDTLCIPAGELGVLGVPLFLFHEGHDATAARAFEVLAQRSGGAVCPFDAASAGQLRELLSAVAVYAAGGKKALADFSAGRGSRVQGLLQQLGGK